MAHCYSHLFNLPTTGLRFFTVYGPWGRPDMALFKFTHSILNGKPIEVFNEGKHTRDFTYIDDIVDGVIKVSKDIAKPNINWDAQNPDPATSKAPWKIYNIGNNQPIKLLDYIIALEKELKLKAKLKFLPLQAGDIVDTNADIQNLEKNLNYKPNTSIEEGISNFVSWYKSYFK